MWKRECFSESASPLVNACWSCPGSDAHTHLALCASHTDRFVLARSIQVVRPAGRGRNERV